MCSAFQATGGWTHLAASGRVAAMGRPKKDPTREPTERRILRAAQDAFGPLGFHGANLADIAAEAGIRRPTLLYYFKSKRELYAAVVRSGFDGLTEAGMRGMAASGDFDDRLSAVVSELAAFAEEQLPLLQIIARELIDPTPSAELVGNRLLALADGLTLFVRTQGGDLVRPGIDVREAILQLVSGFLFRVCGRVRNPLLWSSNTSTLAFARMLLLAKPGAEGGPT